MEYCEYDGMKFDVRNPKWQPSVLEAVLDFVYPDPSSGAYAHLDRGNYYLPDARCYRNTPSAARRRYVRKHSMGVALTLASLTALGFTAASMLGLSPKGALALAILAPTAAVVTFAVALPPFTYSNECDT